MRIDTGLANHQVLQRNRRGTATIVASGTTTATGPVLVTVSGHRAGAARRVGTARDGRFSLRLAGLPVGGPYELTIACGADRVIVQGVRVGDVWILAGQSNMQGYGDLAGALRRAPGVFARSMAGVWGSAREPLHLLAESPDPIHTARRCTAEDAARMRRTLRLGAGPALSFATELHRRTGIPQGLLACAHGGTAIAQWDPARRDEGGASLYGSLYQAWRSTGQPVAGVLWYQGENDAQATLCEAYAAGFQALVRGLRRDLGQPDLPVLTVQLGRVVGMSPGGDRPWNRVQEQQRRMPEQDSRIGVVAAVDLPLADNIHLSGAGQRRLGRRLARLAVRIALGDRAEALPPVFTEVRRCATTDAARCYAVRTAHVVGGLHGTADDAFTLVDAQHRPIDAIIRSEVRGDEVRLFLWPNLIKPGAQVMYGHGCRPAARLTDGRDLALPVTGPLPLLGDPLPGPGLTAWAGGLTLHAERLADLDPATVIARAAHEPIRDLGQPYWPEFMNHHAAWEGRDGVACLTCAFNAPTAMRLLLGFGYDGPVRLWLDGEELHDDPNGTNPCISDRHLIPVRLRAGGHRLALAMDTQGGQAWGFALRWLVADGQAIPERWPSPV